VDVDRLRGKFDRLVVAVRAGRQRRQRKERLGMRGSSSSVRFSRSVARSFSRVIRASSARPNSPSASRK